MLLVGKTPLTHGWWLLLQTHKSSCLLCCKQSSFPCFGFVAACYTSRPFAYLASTQWTAHLSLPPCFVFNFLACFALCIIWCLLELRLQRAAQLLLALSVAKWGLTPAACSSKSCAALSSSEGAWTHLWVLLLPRRAGSWPWRGQAEQ